MSKYGIQFTSLPIEKEDVAVRQTISARTQVELTPSDPIGSDTIRQFPTAGNHHYPLFSDDFRHRILPDSDDRIR